MATVSLAVNLDHALPNGDYAVKSASIVGQPSSTTLSTDEATVAADVATLVADGASPTQGHVNTLNTDWAAFKTVLDAYVVSVNGGVGDVTIIINTTNVTTKNQLKAALRALMLQIDGSNIVTA